MGSKVTFDYSKADAFISAHEMESERRLPRLQKLNSWEEEGAGNDFLSWIDLPVDYDKRGVREKKAAAKDPSQIQRCW